MKKLFAFIFLLLITTGFGEVNEKVALKTFAEEAMKKSLIGNDPVIVISHESVKIYSKLDLKHRVFNNLNKEGLFIIPKNADVIEEFWGETGKINGAIVYKEAQEPKPNIKELRFVLNGKEISRSIADTLDMKNVKGYVCLKNRKNEKCVAFINTIE